MALSDYEYEDAYREVLKCLAQSELKVGTPFYSTGHAGERRCLVNGRLLNDEAVFRLWWGDSIAVQIMDGRTCRDFIPRSHSSRMRHQDVARARRSRYVQE